MLFRNSFLVLLVNTIIATSSVVSHAEWTNQSITINQEANLTAVASAGPGHACAAGLTNNPGGGAPDSYIMCTHSDGTWSETKTAAWGSSMFFVDESTGYLGDFLGKVFRTVDAGASWSPIPEAKLAGMNSVKDIAAWNDGQWVLVAGANGACKISEDGGQSWQPVKIDLPADTEIKAASITNSTVWLAGGKTAQEEVNDEFETIPASPGTDGFVIRIEEGSEPEILVSNLPYDIKDIDFTNKNNGVFSGGSSYEGGATIGYSTDGGETWTNVTPPDLPEAEVLFPKQSDLSLATCDRIDMFDNEKGVALCNTAAIGLNGFNGFFTTSDGGQTWQLEEGFREAFGEGKKGNIVFVAMKANDIAMADCNSGWVVGQGKLIHQWQSDDPGECASTASDEEENETENGNDCGCGQISSESNSRSLLESLISLF